jgi:hypothetical protein
MEITQNMIAFIVYGVVIISLAIIIIGANWNNWTKKKDQDD